MTSKIFISYAHAQPAHVARVAKLVEALHDADLQVMSDRDVTTPQGPPERWQPWMLNRIEEADWVLVVCDEAYYRSFRGTEEPGRGLGARFEGAIISNAIYKHGMRNAKFVPVLFDDTPIDYIPEPLQDSTRYRLPEELSKLLSALGRAGVDVKLQKPISSKRKRGYALLLPAAIVVSSVVLLLGIRSKFSPSVGGTIIDMIVQVKASHIKGTVLDPDGKPVSGARVSVAGLTMASGEQGQFDLLLSRADVEDHMVLRVMANGYQPWSQEVIPNGGAVTAILQR